jgi:hypothetical protein
MAQNAFFRVFGACPRPFGLGEGIDNFTAKP